MVLFSTVIVLFLLTKSTLAISNQSTYTIYLSATKKMSPIEVLERSLEVSLRDSIHKKIDFFQFDGQSLPGSPGRWTVSAFLIHNSNPRGRIQLILGEGDFLSVTPSELQTWFNNLKNKYPTQSQSVFILIEPY